MVTMECTGLDKDALVSLYASDWKLSIAGRLGMKNFSKAMLEPDAWHYGWDCFLIALSEVAEVSSWSSVSSLHSERPRIAK